MSNFIYNHNFNGDHGGREPIQFSFGPSPKRGNTRAIVLACVLFSIMSVLFGCLK